MRSILTISICTLAAVAAQADDLVDIGLDGPYETRIVVDGLTNPSCVTFKPDGTLTVCDSGNGRVILVRDGKVTDYITGFATEYWKVDPDTGKKRFKLGPLSAVWVDNNTLAVTNAGVGDGAETVMFYDGPGTADSGKATNPIGPTTDDDKDKGEGNLTGLSISSDRSTLYLGGQGADAATWVLAVDVKSRKLTTAFSADKAGIDVNSPMATIVGDDGHVLALYSGAGGKDDGLIVKWNPKTMKPVGKWTLPGLTDPMGFAEMPQGGAYVVIDNNWSLTEVKDGRGALVVLPEGADEAEVRVTATKLKGPVSCAFSPANDFYIAQLGSEFDSDKGQVLKVSATGR
jgi:hypothetical protein